MVTFAGTQDDIKDFVTTLISLERDAIAAYEETIERLENTDVADKIREFRADHLHHVQSLTEVAKEIGCDDIPGEGPKSILTKGKVVLADLGGDDAILKAMKTNEDDTVKAYENAIANDIARTGKLAEICQKALEDEKRHRAYMEQQAA